MIQRSFAPFALPFRHYRYSANPLSRLGAGRRLIADAVGRALLRGQVASQQRAGQLNHVLDVGEPQPRGLVSAAGEDMPTIRREGYGGYCVRVAGVAAHLLAGRHIP